MLMLMDWIKLVITGFPNKTGKSQLRILLITLGLALRNVFNFKKIEFKESKIKSEIWNKLNIWLQFQIKYISPKDWARCPAILAVAGGYASTQDSGEIKLNTQDLKNSEYIAKDYSNGFRGYKLQNYKTWISNVTTCIRKAEEISGRSILTETIGVAEIGPGMGALIGIAKFNNASFYNSYDTKEMQQIQKYVSECLKIPNNFCEFYEVNSNISDSNIVLPNKEFNLFAFWSFTEINIHERSNFYNLIRLAKTTVISCNNYFEGVDNFLYLEEIGKLLGKTVNYVYFNEIFGSKIPKYQQSHRLYTLT